MPVLLRRVQLSTVSNNPLAFRICRPVPQIMIDRRAVNEYLTLIGEKELPLNFFEIIDIEDRFPVERVNKLLEWERIINLEFAKETGYEKTNKYNVE